ncbi:(2Fe-2S)-binding protein [Streptomyces albidoflavus]|uniref:(2Fe-2S)-binding protein n=1 Tax=Streptomyces albidoflavus TaxID=1886 RepID=UPI0004C0AF31|nr:(2Fe-2S)-binding protein [Streptomyces albidoflavus]RZE49561.1 (2Fe-2S)-binding protein [Streptomyces albidoflavus]RZE86614.1 (2Fe-2S)-binding protein [Streptomyces albidoflavus]WSD43416.1 (2Fe-2S)-binding protein [Streptomyces albidoflavus]
MSEQLTIGLEIDGRPHTEEIEPRTVLLDLLRERHGLTGVKASCERGVCDACTTLVDGVPTASCSMFAFSADGSSVETVAGQSPGGVPGPVQRAFAECGGFQCGYCTPGMIMLTTALLREHPEPDDAQVREWISSNICRCTGYQMIIDSVHRAAALLKEESA